MTIESQRLVSQGCKILAHAGLADAVWGHVSVRDPHGRGVWIKPGGYGFEEIEPEMVQLIDWEGTLIVGEGAVHQEYPIHTEILTARKDVGAVVHAHPEAAVVFSTMNVPLRALNHEGAVFSPPDIPRFMESGNLIRTREDGQALAATLGERNAALMRNHGVVTVGPDIQTAVVTTILLEKACRIQIAATSAAGEMITSPDSEALDKRARIYSPKAFTSVWNYYLRTMT